MSAFLEGKAYYDNERFSVLGKSYVSTGLVLALKNNRVYGGYVNRKVLLPDFTSLAIDGATMARFDYILNPTITGAVYSPVTTAAGHSVASFSVTASSFSGGRTVFSYYIGANSCDNIFLDHCNLHLNPGDILVVQATIGVFTTVSAALNWCEQF